MFKKLIMSTAFSTAILLSNPLYATDTVIAKVNGDPIYKADLEKFEKSLPPEVLKKAREENKDKLFSSMRDQAIDFKLVGDAAKKANLEKDPEVQAVVNQMKEQILLEAFIRKQLNPLVNDQALKAEYTEFLKTFPKDENEIEVRHIMLEDEASAKKVIEELKAGADFQKLAREKSMDKETAPEGGNLGYIRKGTVQSGFSDAAFALKSGDFTKTPVKTPMGWHVLKVSDIRKAKAPTFEQVKDQLSARVFQIQMKKMVEQLRDKASIERFNADGKPATIGAEAEVKTPETKAPEAKTKTVSAS